MTRARVSQWIAATPGAVFDALVAPASLTCFWLSAASAPLAVDAAVHWSFMVEGATTDTTATRLERGQAIEWRWSDGSTVAIELSPHDGGTAITLVNIGLADADAALNATEGFTLVLADLKTWLESGTSAGIVAGKAKLITARG